MTLPASQRADVEEDISCQQASLTTCQAAYCTALVAAKEAHPSQVCCEAFETGRCAHGKPCECGWLPAPWPWIVYRPGGPVCDCHMEMRKPWCVAAGNWRWNMCSGSAQSRWPNVQVRGDGTPH